MPKERRMNPHLAAQDLNDLLPMVLEIPIIDGVSLYALKQREFVGYDSNEVAKHKEKYSELVEKARRYIQDRVNLRLQQDVKTRSTIQLGHMESEEYFCLFPDGKLGRIWTGQEKVKDNGIFRNTKCIRHSFVDGRDDYDFSFGKLYSTSYNAQSIGLEVTHVKEFGVHSWKFIYLPEMRYAEIQIRVWRTCDITKKSYEVVPDE